MEYNFYDNIYSKLKPKDKKIIREKAYTNLLIEFLLNHLQFKGFPSDFNLTTMNLYRLLNGAYGVTEYKGKLTPFIAKPIGLLTVDGYFDKVIFNSIYDSTVISDLTNNVNCVVGYNNKLKLPDLNIDRYAFYFSETDLSLECNLKFSRQGRVFSCKDDKTKLALENAIKRVDIGEDVTILSDNVLQELLDKDGKDVQTIELNEPNSVEKIQFLSNYHYDLLKRFLWMYGLSMNQSSKLAQQSAFEIASSESGTMVLTHNMLECAEDFCNRVNKLYGLNTSVELGKSWELKEHDIGMCSENDEDSEKPLDKGNIDDGGIDNEKIDDDV